MKRFIVFFLLWAINSAIPVSACGPYYPYGEDIRFILLKPGTFKYPWYSQFSYSAAVFYDPELSNDNKSWPDSIDGNILLWKKRCKNIPDTKDVYQAVYMLQADELNNRSSKNTFIRYLHKTKDKDAINYLIFAKQCSPYNSIVEDPWERNENILFPKRKQIMNEALQRANSEIDEDLKTRYAFLAIRLAYYNGDKDVILKTYNQYFAGKRDKNIIDYWAMYFMAPYEPNAEKRNYYCAQVFLNAPDKRQAIFFDYEKYTDPSLTLKFAANNKEQSAIWMLHGFRKTGKCLDIMKELYRINPNLDGLSFLLLREINKLEDWIFTPYYTSFHPSVENNFNTDFYKLYPAQRITSDRQYARELLEFVNSANLKTIENPLLWRTAKAYLTMMVQDYDSALLELSILLNDKKITKDLIRHLDILKAVCITVKQTDPVISNEIKPILMQEFSRNNYKFIFAIARELEFRGNTSDAAALLSKLRDRNDRNSYSYWQNGIYWKTRNLHHTLYTNFYDDYFYYLDAQYTPEQIEDLITQIQTNTAKDNFSNWKYSVLKKDIPRLYDLLGTKHLRNNDLKSALKNYEKVNDTLWTSKHYNYSIYLDANPFYTNFYNEHARTDADTVQYTKLSLTRKLIQYLHKAEIETDKSDYYYFLAANCYFNMTQYGNSWMMKRYFWTANAFTTKLKDDEEYFGCLLAKQYYLKAKETTKSKKFAALCLRMAGRCERYRLDFQAENRSGRKPEGNRYYRQLKKEFPQYYPELMGNCESFTSYFNARK